MDELQSIERKIREGSEITYEDYQTLRAYREYLDDLEETLAGGGTETRSVPEHASGAGFAIVVGHTANSPGAAGATPIGAPEYAWNKDLARRIEAECGSRGVEVRTFFRDGVGIAGAYGQVEAWGATCVVELHFNAFNRTTAGTETLYDADRHPGSKGWAERLQQAMLAVYARPGGTGDRGIKERDPGDRGYQSVSALAIPTALIEPFFGDNPTEAALGQSRKDALAAAIAEQAAAQVQVA